MIREEAKLALHNLKSWMAPESVSTPIVMLPSTCYIKREPFGTCLIISPWNYPRACWLRSYLPLRESPPLDFFHRQCRCS